MEHAKEQKYLDNENKPTIMLGIKITVNYDTSILIPVAVVTEEPTTGELLWSPPAELMKELERKNYDFKPFEPFRA